MAIHEENPGTPLVVDSAGLFTAVRRFSIDASSRVHAFTLLRTQRGIQYWAVYQDHLGNIPDPNVVVTGIEIDAQVEAPVGGMGLYLATVTYGTGDGPLPFVDGPAVYELEESGEERPVDVDRLGAPIVNSAGVPFTEPIQIPVPLEIAYVRWIRSNQTLIQAAQIARRVRTFTNSTTFLGAARRELLCSSIMPRQLHPNLIHWSARFAFKPTRTILGSDIPGYTDVRVDQGRQVKTAVVRGGVTVLKAITQKVSVDDTDEADTNETPVDTDQLLDGAGQLLADGEDPVLLLFEAIDERDFAAELGINP